MRKHLCNEVHSENWACHDLSKIKRSTETETISLFLVACELSRMFQLLYSFSTSLQFKKCIELLKIGSFLFMNVDVKELNCATLHTRVVPVNRGLLL